VAPSQISLIEAHGTGFFGRSDRGRGFGSGRRAARPERRCALGSVKTNIGHSGSRRHRGPHQNRALSAAPDHPAASPSQRAESGIVLNDSPFFIAQERTPWSANGGNRYAGVSSFGLSGTNAHVVLGEGPKPVPAQPETEPKRAHILPISARSAAALEALARTYREWLLGPAAAGASLEDICYTASVRRSRHPYRTAVAVSSKEELAERLGLFTKEPAVGPPVFRPRASPLFSPAKALSGRGWKTAVPRRLCFPRDRRTMRCLVRNEAGWSLVTELLQTSRSPASPNGPRPTGHPCGSGGAGRSVFAWGIEPDAVIGHSVERLPRYAARAELEDAMRVAIHREGDAACPGKDGWPPLGSHTRSASDWSPPRQPARSRCQQSDFHRPLASPWL
jgi:acyl transferase domain-containing protein